MDAAQPAQADAGPRRAARDRRDDARRVPQAHREGRGARAALPAGLRRRAVGRRHDRDPARPEGGYEVPPRRPHPGRGAGRRGQPVGPLHHRPLPARQGDRPDRRGRVPAAHRDRLDAARSSTSSQRRIVQLEIEEAALEKETDAASAERLRRAARGARRAQERRRPRCGAHWQAEKAPDRQAIGRIKEQLEQARDRARAGRARGRPASAPPSSATAALPELERELEAETRRPGRAAAEQQHAEGGGRRGGRRRGRRRLDRHPGDAA